MASVRDIKVTETLLTLFFAYNVMKRVDSAETEALWLSHDMGHMFCERIFLFSVMARWIAKMLFMLFFAYVTV